jgi:restriction system protein
MAASTSLLTAASWDSSRRSSGSRSRALKAGSAARSYPSSLGTLAPGEYGLIVTLGYFTSQARSKVKPHIRLIGGEELVDLILEHYEALDARYKSVIPLKRMYVPQPLPEN